MLAAYLYAQFESANRIQARRREIWQRYHDSLGEWAARHDTRLPLVPQHCQQSYHMYYLILPSLPARSRLIAHLKARGILAVFHYLPLHLSEMGRRYGGRDGDCPVTEDLADRLLRLPFHYHLGVDEQAEVIDALLAFQDWD